jgi:hypothetical protein
MHARRYYGRFEVFMAVNMKNCVIWDVTGWLLWFLQEPHGVTSQKTPFFRRWHCSILSDITRIVVVPVSSCRLLEGGGDNPPAAGLASQKEAANSVNDTKHADRLIGLFKVSGCPYYWLTRERASGQTARNEIRFLCYGHAQTLECDVRFFRQLTSLGRSQSGVRHSLGIS